MKNWDDKAICPLIQDLLPSLADGIARPETEQAAREHMKTCEACRKIYTDMCPQETDIYPIVTEEISVETFAKKLKILLWTVLCTVILAMAGVTVYAISSDRFYKMQYLEEVSLWGRGYMISEQSQPVSVLVEGALYQNNQRDYSADDPEGHVTFVWDSFSLFTDDYNFLFEDTPFTNSLPGWIPVEEDGSIRSLLGTYNERNMVNEFAFHGSIYSMNHMQDFLLYKFCEDGSFYIVCYPCQTEEEALQKVQNYVEAFALQDSYLWEYVSEHYGDKLN